MIRPHLKDDALLTAIREADGGTDHFVVWWFGQSGFLLKWDRQFLLFDPYLSDSLTKKYADTDKPHVRMTEPVVDPHRLDFVDVITSSHNHTDHLDAETISALKIASPELKLVLPEANFDFARDRLGDATPALIGLDAGTAQRVGAFTFTGVPAAHNEIERDAAGRCLYLGFIVEFGPWCVFHSGTRCGIAGSSPALPPGETRSDDAPDQRKPTRAPRRRQPQRHRGRGARAGVRCQDGHPVPLRHVRIQHRAAGRIRPRLRTACRQPHRVLLNGESWTSRAIGS